MVYAYDDMGLSNVLSSVTKASDALLSQNPFDRGAWQDAFSDGSDSIWNPASSPLDEAKAFLDTPFSGFKNTDTYYSNDLSRGYSGWGQSLPELYAPQGGGFGNEKSSSAIASNIDRWQRETAPWLFDTTTRNNGVSGSIGSTGDSILDGFNGAISAAVEQIYKELGIQIPPNLVKAMLFREGGGKGLRNEAYLRGERVYGFNGIFQSTAASRGIDYGRMLTDDNYAVYALAKVIAGVAMDDASQWGGTGTVASAFGWAGVAARYFSGDPRTNGNWGDENGDTTQSYLYDPYGGVISNMQKWDLQNGGTLTSGVIAGAGGSGGMPTSIWGNVPGVSVSQPFGQTEFSQTPQGQAYYQNFDPAYWGYEGGHSGTDYNTPVGTKLYSPVTGTVMIAGGSPYYYNNGAAGVPGEGELLIQLDNGDQVILGHMSAINVQVGSRIDANTFVGLSGSENGAHVHVEYRLFDPSWQGNADHLRLVDPTQALSGGAFGGGVQAGQGAGVSSYHDVLMLAVTGQLQGGFAPIPWANKMGAGREWSPLLHGSILGALGVAGGATLVPGQAISFGQVPGQPKPINPAEAASGVAIVDLAQSYLGSPYVHGGLVPSGWDCSGFTYYLYNQMGRPIPQGSHEQMAAAVSQGALFQDTSQLQPGDLIFFDLAGGSEFRAGNSASHVAMYIGNGQIIHAANESVGTIISSFGDPYYSGHFLGAWRP